MVRNSAVTNSYIGILPVVCEEDTRQSGKMGVCGYGQGQPGNLYCLLSVHYAVPSLCGGG
jgi:hypothetical protein